ncbi:glycosyltransferase family 2 protein [Nitriliruptoraceae bacterium ZYF776]|nr:glycosyltransferase family 2 protein [Profundirhabdus halotolerans]
MSAPTPPPAIDGAVASDGPADDAAVDPVDLPAPTSDTPVLAVLVAHDGDPWLERTLAGLAAQTHEALEVLAVDNGSTDGSRALLRRHLAEDQVLIADRDLGFGAAVSMALDARASGAAPYVLLVHDDLELAPDAVSQLAVALDDDPRLAVAGPKLLDWDDERRLQSVGWTVDLTGRADSGVDEGELDQGQRDVDRRSLYVSSGGMLVRREAFDELGRFDRRYHLFRDDLDLCWRAWLAGHDVEVVPEAVGRHAASATTYQRLGQTRFIGPRYFAERNTLATLLKNYGPLRLLGVVPLYFLVGVAKVLGFLLTRRLSDAWQTVRAWAWNAVHLRETWRLRRRAQAARTRSDAELRELFGRIAPRLRAYVEAIADWVAGGDVGTAPERAPGTPAPEPETATARVRQLLRRRPVLVAGTTLGLLFLVAALPLFAQGTLRGGEFAPWPGSPASFLADHGAPWHDAAGLGTAEPPSPAQALLGVWQALVLGSSYLAPRLLLLGLMALAWVLALRAAQRYSARKLPRVAAATAYVLSPPAVAALVTGDLGALVVLAALPGILAAGGTVVQARHRPDIAWRAAAAAAIAGAIAGAFVPMVLLVLVGLGVLVLVAALPRVTGAERAGLTARVGLAALGPLALLVPWSFDLLAADGPLATASREPVVTDAWRWLLLSPELPGFPGIAVGVGFLLAGVLGVLLGWRRQPVLVASLWTVAVTGAVVGWWLARGGSGPWPGLPLLATAAAFAGLLAVAFASAEAQLGRHAFGWRQVAVAVTGVAVAVSFGGVALRLVSQPLDAYVVGRETLPAFVTASATGDDPFRVLVLAAGDDGRVDYEIVPGGGPTMAGYGLRPDPGADAVVERTVDALVGGTDPGAAVSLGRLGVRFVHVPDGGQTEALDDALRRQRGLEPRPVPSGRVLAVTGALPVVSVVPAEAFEALVARGSVPEGTDPEPLEARADGSFGGTVEGGGVVVVTEVAGAGFEATLDGRALPPLEGPTVAFAVPEGGGHLEIQHEATTQRGVALTGQLLLVLLVISILLRPPGLGRTARREGGADPAAGPVATPAPPPLTEEPDAEVRP